MQDPYFKRTVVLLCDHNDEGTFGFILNKFVELSLKEILDDIPDFDASVGLGGPVESSNLYYLHNLGDKLSGSVQINEGVFLGGDYEQLKIKLLAEEISPENIRFFVGYSGWGNEQLAEEIKEESWYVTDLNGLNIIDSESGDLWKEALKNMGGEYANLAHFPADPSLN